MNDRATLGYFPDLLHRLRAAWVWIVAQFVGIVLLAFAGLAWTRVPDRYGWQVFLSLLIPLLLIAVLLTLQAGTIRKFLGQRENRASFAMGTLTFVAWALLVWIAWLILDWCSDQIPLWASYLNSRTSAHGRARLLTYEHLQLWLTWLIWICRWILLPGKVIPHAVASAQQGWCLPVRKLIRLLLNWRWWPAVIAAALIGIALSGQFFNAEPRGTVSHQVMTVALKLVGAYLLCFISWVLLLAWCAVLLARQPEPEAKAADQRLFNKLRLGRPWLLGIAVWLLILEIADHYLLDQVSGAQSIGWIITALMILFFLAFLVLHVGFVRSIIGPDEKRVHMIWGILMPVAWALPGLAAAFLLDLYHVSACLVIVGWVLVPGILLPFAAASTEWGARLPWLKAIRFLSAWEWWCAVIAALIYGWAIPMLLMLPQASDAQEPVPGEIYLLRKVLAKVLSLVSGILLLAWFAVLLDRQSSSTEASDSPSPAGSV